jgi:hypothetical protein
MKVFLSAQFYNDSSDVERVALADGEGAPDDLIYVDLCVAVGCTNKDSHQVICLAVGIHTQSLVIRDPGIGQILTSALLVWITRLSKDKSIIWMMPQL